MLRRVPDGRLRCRAARRHRAIVGPSPGLTHPQHLEVESIRIFREVVAEREKPAMLYSIGKISSVMQHLARKAFYLAPPPFPLMHVDTTWKTARCTTFATAWRARAAWS